MPRLNIYIPDELDLAIRTHRGEMNISQVCAAAIRAELSARSDSRHTEWLFTSVFLEPSAVDKQLMQRFALKRAISGGPSSEDPAQSVVAVWTSLFLDRTVFEGLKLAIGGGVQMWDVVRRLEPRNVGMPIWAIGYGDVDRALPHVHPNAIVTILSLLYTPRSKAMLVGTPKLYLSFAYPSSLGADKDVRRLILGSCSMFDAESPYAQVLGKEMTDFLVDEHVTGDFLGVFFTADGRIIEPYAPSMTVSHISSSELRELSKRDDCIVLLAAGGGHKVKLIRQVLEAGLCNALITDGTTASALLGLPERHQ